VSKYYLNVSINDKPILTITSGELKKIDKFIIKNNICNVEQLYNHIKDDIKLDLNNDSVEFTIDYKHGGEIKNKPLFYRDVPRTFWIHINILSLRLFIRGKG